MKVWSKESWRLKPCGAEGLDVLTPVGDRRRDVCGRISSMIGAFLVRQFEVAEIRTFPDNSWYGYGGCGRANEGQNRESETPAEALDDWIDRLRG